MKFNSIFFKRAVFSIIVLSGVWGAAFFFFGMPQNAPRENSDGGSTATQRIKNRLDACLAEKPLSKIQQECLKTLARFMVFSNAFPSARAMLDNMRDPRFLAICHEFGHYTGWELFQKTKDVLTAYQESSHLCDSGMYHGIMEAYLATHGDTFRSGHDTASVVLHACDSVKESHDTAAGYMSLCLHGVGHGLMFVTDNDLPRSLIHCDALGDQKESCYTGVYMENGFTSSIPEWSEHAVRFAPTRDDPSFPCRILEARHQKSCYRYQGTLLLELNNWDWPKGLASCAILPEQFRDICMVGIGNNTPAPSLTIAQTAEKCALGLQVNERAYELCIVGAVQFLAQLRLGDAHALAEFCGLIQKAQQARCIEESGKMLPGWLRGNETIADKCAVFHDEEKRCLAAASGQPYR